MFLYLKYLIKTKQTKLLIAKASQLFGRPSSLSLAQMLNDITSYLISEEEMQMAKQMHIKAAKVFLQLGDNRVVTRLKKVHDQNKKLLEGKSCDSDVSVRLFNLGSKTMSESLLQEGLSKSRSPLLSEWFNFKLSKIVSPLSNFQLENKG